MNNLIQLKQSELQALRKRQWLKQNKICPILKQEIPFEKSVFDHKHRTKKEKIGEDGNGLLRGVIHTQANVMEGKIVRLYRRYGLDKFIALPELLHNIAEYIKNPPMKPEYIHPNEKEKSKKLGKRQYQKICKVYFKIYPKRKKLPVYPKSGKMTKEFQEIIDMIDGQ
jgi:hypothetical protein